MLPILNPEPRTLTGRNGRARARAATRPLVSQRLDNGYNSCGRFMELVVSAALRAGARRGVMEE